jgi:hypothetical protein
MSIVWACCSSKRSDTIGQKTIRTLERGGFKGTLFVVVPHEEVATYTTALSACPISIVIQGSTKGQVNQRLHLRSQWPPGQEIVFFDDDVTAVKIWVEGRLKHCLHIHELVDACFQWTACHDALLWGVYPICNPLFMKPRTAIGNAYVVGAFYGCINDPRLEEFPEMNEMEDYARQLGEQAAGRPPIRFNWIGIETRYYKNKGGLQQTRTPTGRIADIQYLEGKYPTLVKSSKKRNGVIDLKFLGKPEYRMQEVDSVMAALDVSGGQSTVATMPDAAPVPPFPSDLPPL